MDKDTALDLALEALEKSLPRLAPYGEQDWLDSRAAITAIKQARSAPVQEPVAIADGTFNHNCPIGTPLYTTAAQRPWVGLTDEERTKIRREHYARTLPLMDAVEAKLRSKNNG